MITSSRHPYYYTISFALLIAAGMWGLFWIPQRALEAGGLTGGWATISQMVIPFAMLLPISLWRLYKGQSFGLEYPLIGLLFGGGIACYANSFLLTDVVRALILFYITPVWTTIFEIVFLRQIPRFYRYITLVLALSGVWIVFGQEGVIPLPQNSGDWIALLGGILIAASAVRMEIKKPEGIYPILFSFFFYGGLFTLIQSYFLSDYLGDAPSIESWVAMMPWLILIAILFHIPTNIVILGAPSRIGAGIFSIIILFEIVVGTFSAAVLTDELIGWREILGSSFIIFAGLTEIIFASKTEEDTG
jgi:drug/metabolite transporter (DMT)-like permease